MSKEQRGITRRDFNRIIFATAVGTYLNFHQAVGQIVGDVVSGMCNKLLDDVNSVQIGIQDKVKEVSPPISESVRAYPQSGWLETYLSNRPELINPSVGCKNYIRYCCLNHPVLRIALKDAYADFYTRRPQPPKLGDMLKKHIDIAGEALQKEFHKKDTVLENTEPKMEDKVHVAMFTMAAVLSPYFSQAEIRGINPEINNLDEVSNEDIKWLKFVDPYILKILPAHTDGSQSNLNILANYRGGDRAMHFMQHLFLVYQLQYSIEHQLQDQNRVPRGTELVNILTNVPELRTFLKSNEGGLYWEVIETLNYINGKATKDELGQTIPTGFYDKFVSRDLISNNLGASVGLILNIIPLNGMTVEMIVNLINSGIIYQVASNRHDRVDIVQHQVYPHPMSLPVVV